MEQRFTVFEHLTNNDELIEDFNKAFSMYNLDALFTDEYRSTPIRVTYTDLKSVVNDGGAYNQVLRNFSDIIAIANDNKKFQEAMFMTIYYPRTFQSFMNRIKKIIKMFTSLTSEKHIGNFWNMVFYSDDLR